LTNRSARPVTGSCKTPQWLRREMREWKQQE
jgi:hypothetical protein